MRITNFCLVARGTLSAHPIPNKKEKKWWSRQVLNPRPCRRIKTMSVSKTTNFGQNSSNSHGIPTVDKKGECRIRYLWTDPRNIPRRGASPMDRFRNASVSLGGTTHPWLTTYLKPAHHQYILDTASVRMREWSRMTTHDLEWAISYSVVILYPLGVR